MPISYQKETRIPTNAVASGAGEDHRIVVVFNAMVDQNDRGSGVNNTIPFEADETTTTCSWKYIFDEVW